jgi:hypothetical protein
MTNSPDETIDNEMFEYLCERIRKILIKELDPAWIQNLSSQEDGYYTKNGVLRIVYEKGKKDD